MLIVDCHALYLAGSWITLRFAHPLYHFLLDSCAILVHSITILRSIIMITMLLFHVVITLT
jgi:hypothetical protein